MTSHLDLSAFPHVWDTIVSFADAKALLALRATSRSLSKAADRRLVAHLSTAGPYSIMCYARHCISCISPHLKIDWDGTPSSISTLILRAADPALGKIRVSIHNRAMRGCKALDLLGPLPPPELALLASRVQPRTVRLSWPTYYKPFKLASTEAALAALRPRTAIVNFTHINHCISECGAHIVGRHMRTLTVPEVRRVVGRQRARGPYYTVRGARELVLIFLHPGEAHISLVHQYFSELARLPRAVITLVGLETMVGDFDAAVLAIGFAGVAEDHGSRFEILSHAQYHFAVGTEQWAFELGP
jgi:hypothetical protein